MWDLYEQFIVCKESTRHRKRGRTCEVVASMFYIKKKEFDDQLNFVLVKRKSMHVRFIEIRRTVQ